MQFLKYCFEPLKIRCQLYFLIITHMKMLFLFSFAYYIFHIHIKIGYEIYQNRILHIYVNI